MLSRQTWLADSVQRNYTYSYDKANRYNNAIFSGSATENYNENAAYDANGNILALNRFGKVTPTSFSRIDSLNYTYASNSNKLTGISDLANYTLGHKDNGNSSDYTFYNDGSQKSDANKGITNIIYNYLGLQEEIIFSPTQKIKNVYTSDGQKLIQYLIDGSATIQTDYIGELIYRNDSLQTIFHEEGRIRVDTGGKAHYQYFIEDHLGNNRVVFEKLNDSVFVAQRTDYYPFGSPFTSDGLQFKFLYQGKEYIDFLGLNEYDFHARGLDTWTGRFSGVDPVDNVSLSGYASMLNNPNSYIDPDGKNPALIGAAIGAISYTLQTAFSKGGFKNWNWMQFGISTISGAVFGGISAGIGESVSTIANSGIKFAVQTGAHSIMGGLNSTLNGGSFKSGLIAGAAGSVWGSVTGNLGPLAQVGGSALFSGISAELSGGSFWQGAAIGGITSGLNHAMHQITKDPAPPKPTAEEIKLLMYSGVISYETAIGMGISISALRLALGSVGLALTMLGDVNPNKYYVYEIYGKSETAKFGTTQQSDAKNRPQSQISGIFKETPSQGKPSWVWHLQRVSKPVAFATEKYLVYNYYNQHNKMPYAQFYPYQTAWTNLRELL